MTSPEQQPAPQSEKNSADPGLDIDAANKYLEEAYGPEKSSIIVDRSIPIPEKAIEEKEQMNSIEQPPQTKEIIRPKEAQRLIIPEQYGEPREIFKSPRGDAMEDADKREEERRRQEEEKTIRFPREKREFSEGGVEIKIGEKIKEEKETQDAQVEAAKNELIDLAKNIKEAKERKESKTEYSLYGKAKEVFETATGENLEKIAREKAKTEAEKDGFKIITPEEYRKEKTAKTQDRIRDGERSKIIRERWSMLSAQEKEKYFSGEDNKNDVAAINSARIKFATELNKKIGEKIAELSKGKKGISISEDVFYELMEKGFKSEDIKRTGFWHRILAKIWLAPKGVIEMSSLDKTDERGPKRMTREKLAEMEVMAKDNIEDTAEEEIKEKIKEGQRRWRAKKQRHTGEIIQETAVKYEAEKKLKVKPEAVQNPKIEIVSRIGREGTPEQIKVLKKIVKQAMADRKNIMKVEKTIRNLIKKQKKGESLNNKEITYLSTVELNALNGMWLS